MKHIQIVTNSLFGHISSKQKVINDHSILLLSDAEPEPNALRRNLHKVGRRGGGRVRRGRIVAGGGEGVVGDDGDLVPGILDEGAARHRRSFGVPAKLYTVRNVLEASRNL